jgi:hypothetical protein
MKLIHAAALALAAAGVPAAAQPTPTPAAPEQHVVAPSLPDQPNKEGVVRPSGSLPTDTEGYVRSGRGAVDPSTGTPAPRADGSASGAPAARAPGPGVALPGPTPASAPSGQAKVKAAYMSLLGTVKSYAKGVSITIAEENGVERTVKLAARASVYDGLAPGDRVVVRVPLGKPSDGMSADRVSKQAPAKAPPKSKFSAAESPVR